MNHQDPNQDWQYQQQVQYSATGMNIKTNKSEKAKKITIRALAVLAVFVAEGVLMWGMADSKISYSPVKNDVIAGVKPPKQIAKSVDKPIEKSPLLAVADMYLVVPKLYINTPIEPVGVTANGEMATSQSLQRVAWYKDGGKPGAQGSVVLAGHYGGPQEVGIFRTMDKLESGDSLEVRSKDGSSIKYTVYKKATYNAGDVPLQELFNKSDGKYLNLITCVGSWNSATNSYDKRLIVYAKID
jgi:hypothetical protein